MGAGVVVVCTSRFLYISSSELEGALTRVLTFDHIIHMPQHYPRFPYPRFPIAWKLSSSGPGLGFEFAEVMLEAALNLLTSSLDFACT